MTYFKMMDLTSRTGALLMLLFIMNLFSPIYAQTNCPLLIGETLPDAVLKDNEGKELKLKDLTQQKASVFVFYRGGWCPYCNKQLSGLVDIETEIREMGYQIIAISPDDYQNLKPTALKDSIHYTLLSDPNGELIQKIGIAFKTPTLVKGFAALKGQKGETSDVIPIPTVMIVNTKGEILFEYINPNYKERISGTMLLAILKTLNN